MLPAITYIYILLRRNRKYKLSWVLALAIWQSPNWRKQFLEGLAQLATIIACSEKKALFMLKAMFSVI